MREIEFRGKRLGNGEWVYSDLSQDNISYLPKDNLEDFLIEDVITETIGQYTGLKDKNGTKIFEGDIVEYELGRDYFSKAKIVFEDCQFKCIDLINRLKTQPAYMSVEFEVIGNIHDNPELLEV